MFIIANRNKMKSCASVSNIKSNLINLLNIEKPILSNSFKKIEID